MLAAGEQRGGAGPPAGDPTRRVRTARAFGRGLPLSLTRPIKNAHPRRTRAYSPPPVRSFLRRKYGKLPSADDAAQGAGLAVIGKFDAEGQSVTPNQAAAPMRRAVRRQEQEKLVRQLDVIL